MTARASKLDGNHIVYHYLQKQLRTSDGALFQALVAKLIASLGIWFSPGLYAQLPILLPHVVRDGSCRPRGKQVADEWGAPDREGYYRDDNSLVKVLPRALRIQSACNRLYRGKRLGGGFVASHVWRSADVGQAEAKVGWTNTFVPNLVWLPTQVAKLTDRVASFAQVYLQRIAYKLYRGVTVLPQLYVLTEAAWQRLPEPEKDPQVRVPDMEDLNFFEETSAFIQFRRAIISKIRDGLQSLKPFDLERLRPSRYAEGLTKMSTGDVQQLAERLSSYLSGTGER